jgi:glycosyltransferase involved in cell wall biosynthesis
MNLINQFATPKEGIAQPKNGNGFQTRKIRAKSIQPEVLFITSYPARECGIAAYSQDLIAALHNKFGNSFDMSVCAIENGDEKHVYNTRVRYLLQADEPAAYLQLAGQINADPNIVLVVLQHEFGFFDKKKNELVDFVNYIKKPFVIVFHTVLPNPDNILYNHINHLADNLQSIIVMTNNSANILNKDYHIPKNKITVIPHGTHLVMHTNKDELKEKYNLTNKLVLSTFGLLSSGKGITTTLNALPEVIKKFPNVIFLIIGKTHPTVVKNEGEKYREGLAQKVAELKLENHVQFINYFLPLPELLEYLQLTDIYLFTSKDPNQAVSGTFAYAVSSGCPIIATPIPHAMEVLKNDAGIIVDFENATELSAAILNLLNDEQHRNYITEQGLNKMAITAWENAALAHVELFKSITGDAFSIRYTAPPVNLNHIKRLTTEVGIIQFAKIFEPDLSSGYTLDDNSRMLIAACKHYDLFSDSTDLQLIQTYLNFIQFCLLDDSYFLNYVDIDLKFTPQNYATNLADANGRAIWALGFLLSKSDILPVSVVTQTTEILDNALICIDKIYSTRAMAFIVKGLYYKNGSFPSKENTALITVFANRFVQMYKHEKDNNWHWFESYLTYANSILPEAMLCAYLVTGDETYKQIAKESFDFLLTKIFRDNTINVVSNKTWLHKDSNHEKLPVGGEQPIDVAYTILSLDLFYSVFEEVQYLKKMTTAFNWFHGRNHLHKIVYNPCTGGCYDGVEENSINLNQGAESSISYLLARLTLEENGNLLHQTTGTEVYLSNRLAMQF